MSAAPSRDVRLVTLACLTALAVCAPSARAADGPAGASRGGESAALRLLERAAVAARSVGYAGTQYVASWSGAASSSTLADVAHDPTQGTVVTRPSSAGPGQDADELVAPDGGPAGLEERLLAVLARHYVLRVVGEGACAGRSADLVEARRAGAGRSSSPAGRFWLDRETGLVLRREVYDDRGRAVRSSAFLELTVFTDQASAGPAEADPSEADPSEADPSEADPSEADPSEADPSEADPSDADPSDAALERVRDLGWHAPERLPGGFTVFDARLRDDDRRLHLSYSDGLSTLSLFAQRGDMGAGPAGFERRTVDGAPVWSSSSTPERVVWSGGGHVWTMVSDAPVRAVHAAVSALPHDPPPDDGVLARLGRGLKRMGSMLNPFG